MIQANDGPQSGPGRAAYKELFSTAVLTATIVKVFAAVLILSLVYNAEVWQDPVTWTVGGGAVVLVFGAAYWLSLRLLDFGPRGTRADLAYPVFSLLVVIIILLFTGPRISYLNALFFFPVIIATLTLGRRGMVAVPVAVAFILGMNMYFAGAVCTWCVTDNLLTSVVLVFTAWLVGEATETNRRVNRELAENTHFLRTVVDALPLGVLTMDRRGEVLSVNRYWRTLTGPDPEREAQGLDTIRELLARSGHCQDIGELYPTGDAPVPVQVSRHQVAIRSGEADLILVQNLADRRKLQEMDLMFRHLLAAWDQGVIFLDREGRVRMHNDAARRYLGLKGDFEGQHLSDFLPELEPGAGSLVLVREDRHLLVARNLWAEAPDGGPWTVLTIADTTAQRKAELEMQRARNLSSLGQVAAGVAHELRNPLTAIKGFTQLALESKDPHRSASLLAFVQEEIERMQEILDRFLLMSKPAQPSYTQLDLREVVHWIWNLIYNDSLSRQIILVRELPGAPLPVRGDGQQLRQVVLNLVNNAFEATPAGGRVTISCAARDEHAVLTVRDTGRGIPARLLDEIFVPFVTTKDSGTGLGLAISQEIIQKHGGRLAVESSAEGTVFRILLPRTGPA